MNKFDKTKNEGNQVSRPTSGRVHLRLQRGGFKIKRTGPFRRDCLEARMAFLNLSAYAHFI
jgi:hypothetical protein